MILLGHEQTKPARTVRRAHLGAPNARTQQGERPRRTVDPHYTTYLVFDLDVLHLTSEDRRVMGQMVKMRLRQDVADMREEAEDELRRVSVHLLQGRAPQARVFARRKKYFDTLSLSTVDGDASVRTQVQKWDARGALNLDTVGATSRRGALMIGKNIQTC